MSGAIPYDDIVWACTHLCDLLDYENEALAAHDMGAVRELAENKAALARIYEESVLPLAEDPQLVDTLEPEQREELTVLGQQLKELVEENARLIKAEMEAYQLLMDTMVHAVQAANTAAVTYGRGGAIDAHSADGGAMGLNHTL